MKICGSNTVNYHHAKVNHKSLKKLAPGTVRAGHNQAILG